MKFLSTLYWVVHILIRDRGRPRLAWEFFNLYHRLPGRCWKCERFTLLHNREAVAYSTGIARLCEECAVEERKEVQAAWDEYYSSRL